MLWKKRPYLDEVKFLVKWKNVSWIEFFEICILIKINTEGPNLKFFINTTSKLILRNDDTVNK